MLSTAYLHKLDMVQPIFLGLSFLALLGGACSSPADVNIFNQVGETITLHCKSKNDDLGGQTLRAGQQFGWGFRPNFGGSTLFYCGFRWGGRSQMFDVWTDRGWYGWTPQPCEHCEWRVSREGFFVNEARRGPSVFVHLWL